MYFCVVFVWVEVFVAVDEGRIFLVGVFVLLRVVEDFVVFVVFDLWDLFEIFGLMDLLVVFAGLFVV